MGDTFRLAMQLTMIDMLSGVATQARNKINQLGEAGKEVGKNFEQMERHATAGLKAIALTNYTINKIKPGVAAAADLQESIIEVRMNLMRSGKDAATLKKELAEVRSTAIDLQKITPFSAVDVTHVQNKLLESGVDFQEVVGKGATRAAMMLATITKSGTDAAADAMLNIGIPYHLKSSEYGQVADVIQRHVMSGRMKLPDLNAGLPYVSQTAKNLKVPWDDLLTGMAVLGEQGQLGSMAGTHLKDFYGRLTGASRISRRIMTAVNQDLVGKGKAPLEFWDKKGEMLPTHDLIKNLRASMGSYNTKQRMFILEKIFGEQGGLAAMALMSEGTGSWEFVKQKALEVAGAEEKMAESLKGFNRNVTALQGTMKSTAALLFDPWLVPLTEITKKANDAVDAIGKFADKHPKTTDTINGVLAAGVATAAGYGVFKLARAALYGGKVLKGLHNMPVASLAMGVAEGKMLQAATGVTPVFVTNWPGGILPNGIPGNSEGKDAINMVTKAVPWAAIAGYAAGAAAALGIPFSFAISNAQRENGWGSQTWSHDSREYEVMGIGGKKRDINLSIQIDSQGRLISSSDDMSHRITTVKRGAFFDDLLTGH